MKINMYDPPFIHGITVCGEDGEPINYVQQFDTDTFMCWLRGGKRCIASAYAIFVSGPKDMQRFLSTLPDSVQQHIYPHLVGGDAASEDEMAARKEFILRQIAHTARLRSLLPPAGDVAVE